MLVGWEVPNVDELTSPFPPNKSVQGDDLDTLLGTPRDGEDACSSWRRAEGGPHTRPRSDESSRSNATREMISIPSLVARVLPLGSLHPAADDDVLDVVDKAREGRKQTGNEGGSSSFSMVSKHDLVNYVPSLSGSF